MFNGKTHYKWPLSIAFCMFTRGYLPASHGMFAPKTVPTSAVGPYLTGRGRYLAFSCLKKSDLTMVYGRYNELVNGVYKPTFTSLGGSIL